MDVMRRSDTVSYEDWMSERFPLDPLMQVLAARFDGEATVAEMARCVGVTQRTVSRWRQRGLTCESADAAAVALGFHPALVWPEWWLCPWLDKMDDGD